MTNAPIIELTQEELEIILKKREKEAKHEAAEKVLAKLKEDIKALEKLGYYPRIGRIGGKYVPSHCPRVTTSELSISELSYY
jgi:hypothetical protein